MDSLVLRVLFTIVLGKLKLARAKCVCGPNVWDKKKKKYIKI